MARYTTVINERLGGNIQGLDSLDRKLAELENQMAGKVLYQALNFATNPMLKEAKDKAPSMPNAYKRYMSSGQGQATFKRTKNGKIRRGKSKRAKRGHGKYVIQQAGVLKKSIHRMRAKSIKDGAGVGIYIHLKGKKTGNSAFYWHMVEYGTSKMTAQPYLRPAFHNNKDIAVNRFGDKLKQAIDKAVRS